MSPDTGTLAAYSAADGAARWSRPVEDADATSAPTVADGLVYVATTSGLHIVDAFTGAEVTTLAGSCSGEPVVSTGRVVVDCAIAPLGAGLCALAAPDA